MGRRFTRALVLLTAVALAGCGSSGLKPAAPQNTTSLSSASTEVGGGSAPSSAGQTAGLDDYDGDGRPDPTCGTQDFGAGLVLRIPCQISTAHDTDEGTTLVKDSLFRLPSISIPELESVSATALVARDATGLKVTILFLNSDTLFDTGSAALSDPAAVAFDGIIAAIKNRYPAGTVQVRGHTDATGSASLNQTLSEQRAAAVKGYFASHGLDPSKLSTVGLGSARPIVEERKPDGSDNPKGRQVNRRVEIVVRSQ